MSRSRRSSRATPTRHGRWPRAVLIAGLAVILITMAAGAVVTGVSTHRAAADYPPLGQLVETGGVRLHVVERGSGPPVVMVHGNPGFVDEFLPLADRLADAFRVVAVDRPGHGHSGRPSLAGTGPVQQVRLIRAALDSLAVPRPRVLVGHSWGGGVALIWALEHPAEVAGLVLIASRAFPREGDDPLYRLIRAPVVGVLLRHTVLFPLSRSRVDDGLAAAYAPEPPEPAHLAVASALWTRPGQVGATVWDTRNLNTALEAYAPRYGELRMPVEILVGDQDEMRPESERLHAAVEGANLMVLPDAGHEVHRTRLDEVRAAVARVRR